MKLDPNLEREPRTPSPKRSPWVPYPKKATIANRPCLISASFRRFVCSSLLLAKPRGSKAPPG